MVLTSALSALSGLFPPARAYWSALLRTNKRIRETDKVHNYHHQDGEKFRIVDWALDIVSTGDIYKIQELCLHCPDGRVATLDLGLDNSYVPFQFKTKSMGVLTGGIDLEFMVIGRVIDKVSGACECFAWDYRPKPGQDKLVAYKTSVYNFGAWRDTVTPIGALGIDVQGFRL